MMEYGNRIAELEKRVSRLEMQVTQLLGNNPAHKSREQIQDDWAKRNLGILDKGPLPYAHKTGHAGSMTIGSNHD